MDVEAAIPETVLAQLEALDLDWSRPMVVVDVDEVIVGLAAHLGRFAEASGYRLVLTGYRLDGALKRRDGSDASPEEWRTLFRDFFARETVRQEVYPDAPAVLARLGRHASVVVLTNVPARAREARVANLAGHGIDAPLIANTGPKGPALAWLATRCAGRVAFIDDSPSQIASAAKDAPGVVRIHFVGDAELRAMVDPLDAASHSPESWREIETTVADVLGLPGA